MTSPTRLHRTARLAATLAAAGLPFALAAQTPDYSRIDVGTPPGAAFVVAGHVLDNPEPDMVVSAFGRIERGPSGPIFPAAGTVTLYAHRGTPQDDKGLGWEAIPIVTLADGIAFPNRPLLADVDRDGDTDVIVPGGFFWDAASGRNRGSITWWENGGKGRKWIRHDVVTNSPFVYHSVALLDLDGDGNDDIVTVGENPGLPASPNDDIVELQFLRGNGDGTFQAPKKLADGGGSFIVAHDVNGDGRIDFVSAQYFGPVQTQPMVPEAARTAANASFVWFENQGHLHFARHAIGIAQGPSNTIVPVSNLLGDGVERWIATNHTNPNLKTPPFSLYPVPAVYEFTPGPDPREPWAVRTLSAPGAFPVTGGMGQAAPGELAAGDLNGDGRLDIAVSGDGSRAVYWLEQRPDKTFITHRFPASAGFGQAGGPAIVDYKRDNSREIAFASFDQSGVAIWSR